ncbi:hypothetical protein PF005_g29442 [Phytophthora fragariae]|uniref:Uncharacterized protein n=1 Tax=Phytophthora fragariae TaxID=53985 RepID=A0A6A3VE21_9STRA|nr:hypothetical protein PF009_g33014 [Phytophthora fragariae]KAE9165829.1 hypothetical protein PF005_g29442 [Phytophthora fragariae]KAE9264146.1 hypothetical protein PF001_g31408 [Phytophthora fragariae]
MVTVTAAIAMTSALRSGTASPPLVLSSPARSASSQARVPSTSFANAACHT